MKSICCFASLFAALPLLLACTAKPNWLSIHNQQIPSANLLAATNLKTAPTPHVSDNTIADASAADATTTKPNISAVSYRDIPYANQSAAQTLDFYLPKKPVDSYPAILLLHGGMFYSGDKDLLADKATWLAENGYIAVPTNYRLSDEASFPAAVHDVKAAVRFLRANAEKYHIDNKRIGAWGISAGGNLSAMLATTANNAYTAGNQGYFIGYDDDIVAAVIWSAPLDFLNLDADFKALNLSMDNNSINSAFARYLGARIHHRPDISKKASPITYLSDNDAAMFIQAGGKDPGMPYLQSQRFYHAAKPLLKERIHYQLIAGAGHADKAFNTPDNLKQVLSFLDKYLKNITVVKEK